MSSNPTPVQQSRQPTVSLSAIREAIQQSYMDAATQADGLWRGVTLTSEGNIRSHVEPYRPVYPASEALMWEGHANALVIPEELRDAIADAPKSEWDEWFEFNAPTSGIEKIVERLGLVLED